MKDASIGVLIVDDEPLARDRLRYLLQRVTDVELVGECTDGATAIAAIIRDRPDLVLLDIQMPGLDGFGVIERVGAHVMPQTIFVTAYDTFAVRAFERGALDYLVKPFSDDRFFDAIERARVRVRQARLDEFHGRLTSLLNDTGRRITDAPAAVDPPADVDVGSGPLERFAVRSGGKVQIVRAEAIDWIEAEGVYVRLHAGGASYLLRTPLHTLETRLDARRFVRIHRSVIVNIDRVNALQQEERGDYQVLLLDGTKLRLSRSRKANLERLLGSSL